jgi:chitodextrinase
MVDKVTSGYVALAAPTGVAVTGVTDTSVSLSWNSVSSAAGYNVYRDGAKVNASAIASTAFTDSGLTSGTGYSYTVKATTASGGTGAASVAVNATTTGTPPPLAAPTGLTVSSTTSSAVSLSWSAVSGATGYNVYRNGSKVNASAITTTSYTNTGLAASTTYSYTATALNANGESAVSGAVNATTKSSFTCTTTLSNNYTHVQNGRAHDSGGYALANGSNQNMGLDNLFYTSTLAQTSAGYYIIGNCPP